MSDFEVYQLYLAIKLHFSSDTYDFFKFNGKTRTNIKSFEKRKDKYFFKKLSLKFSREELIQYFVAHFVQDDNTWIGDISRIGSTPIYKNWLTKIQSMSFVFSNDMDKLLEDTKFENLFKITNTHPPLIKKYLAKQVSLETLVILNTLVKYMKDFDTKITDPLVWPDIKKRVVKYEPFLSVDRPKYKQIVLSKVQP